MSERVGFIGLGIMGRGMAQQPAQGGVCGAGVESHGQPRWMNW